MYRRAVHIFRRDIRLADNTAFLAASKGSVELLPAFIFDPRQVSPHPYRSLAGQQFLFSSLQELDRELRLHNSRLVKFYGEAHQILEQLLLWGKNSGAPFEAVYINRDYTPFSRNRDRALHELCEQHGARLHLHGDALLHEPETVKKDDGTPYTVYTPFSKRALQHSVREPVGLSAVPPLGAVPPFSVGDEIFDRLLPDRRTGLFRSGGRQEGVTLLTGLGRFRAYDEERDFPALHATTGLSPHHKFGTLSVREVFQAIEREHGRGHTLIRELLWRDFFHHIAFHYPQVFQGAFQRSMDGVRWREDERDLKRWEEGQTGFPIVDAGMRELNTTGFMHNRVRMIVASFLTKDLQLHWKLGEQYFARNLIDFDPCVNNGNWQWAASTGCDAQPYFRIFNPWLQQQKFDEDAQYIKRWVPELKLLSAKQIHALGDDGASRPSSYPQPMVDHAEAKEATLTMFAEAKERASEKVT